MTGLDRAPWAALGWLAGCLALVVASQNAQAVGDVTKGAAVFVRQCALCHTINNGGSNRFGPNLFGIVDRKAASAPGFKYSKAFKKEANWTWSPDAVRSFVMAPALVIPGNRMSVFQGVSDKDLDDLMAYLVTQK